MRREGLTLIEVLVALVIIALTTLLFFSFIQAFASNNRSREETLAQVYARSYFEAVRLEWSRQDGTYGFNTPLPPPPSGIAKLPAGFEVVSGPTVQSECVEGKLVMKTITIVLKSSKGKTFTFQTRIAAPTFEELRPCAKTDSAS